MKTAYLIGGYRTAVGKSGRGALRFTRPDDMAAQVIRGLMKDFPEIDKEEIDDVIVGNAMPEAEQGLNVGRLISLLGLDTDKVPGMTVNRYCSSGLETIALAVAKIERGMGDCIIAGGVESMSYIPMGGWKVTPNYGVSKTHPTWYNSMGHTAEAVAKQFGVSREDQDAFAFASHQKALAAIASGRFKDEILPLEIEEVYLDASQKRKTRTTRFEVDEGPRATTSMEALAKLRPVFDAAGSVTAGNSSQTSDGAAFVMVVSEDFLKRHHLKPWARMVSYAVVGVEPRIMGIGPVDAVPKALAQANMTLDQIDLFELNEAFASQSLAVVRELGLDTERLNVNGGAIALGHPLGCTGGKLTVQLLREMKRRDQKYGMVTMCVGTGQGAAGIFELLD